MPYNLNSPILIEAELFPLAIDQGIGGVISYNPLAGGLLTERYEPGQTPQEGTRFTVQNARSVSKSSCTRR